MIALKTYTPARINHIVKSMWYLEVTTNDEIYEEDIIPDAHHEIIFHVNNHAAKRKTANNTWIDEPEALIAAQTVTSYKLRLSKGAKLYGIRFYPHTLYALLKAPVHLFNDTICSLSDVMETGSFNHCIAGEPHRTFLNFEQFLFEKLSSMKFHSHNYSYVQVAVAEILKRHGNIAVDGLIKKTGVSGKYLDTLFDKYVGLGPKTICRIVQLNHFISYKCSQTGKSLTECSYEAGYYDQAHLIKSFRTFANTSPSAYFKKGGSINDFFAGL